MFCWVYRVECDRVLLTVECAPGYECRMRGVEGNAHKTVLRQARRMCQHQIVSKVCEISV
jgi:hypothetical protein